MKKRASRQAAKPPPAGRDARAVRGNRPGAGRTALIREPGPILYKVVELSTVDEASLERTLNDWAKKGWNLDGVQFAMREQSKRPSMAFVFFTREGEPEARSAPRSEDEARVHLRRLAEAEDTAQPPVPVSAYERLRQLAEDDDEPEPNE